MMKLTYKITVDITTGATKILKKVWNNGGRNEWLKIKKDKFDNLTSTYTETQCDKNCSFVLLYSLILSKQLSLQATFCLEKKFLKINKWKEH